MATEAAMVEVVAGRMYRVLDGSGEEIDRGLAKIGMRGQMCVESWNVDGWRRGGGQIVEVDEPKPDAAPIAAESTEDRHAADEQDMQHDGLPRLHKKRLRVRQLHALERIADVLDVMLAVTMDVADAWGALGSGGAGDDEGLPGEEPVQ